MLHSFTTSRFIVAERARRDRQISTFTEGREGQADRQTARGQRELQGLRTETFALIRSGQGSDLSTVVYKLWVECTTLGGDEFNSLKMYSARSWIFRISPWLSRISAILLWLLFLMPVDAQNINHSDEVQILKNFIAASFGGPFPDSVHGAELSESWPKWSWNASDENACAWVGITCTSNFTVEKLDLSGWGPSTLFGLKYLSYLADLRELDLSSNNLGSELPLSEIVPPNFQMANFTGLTRLDLSRNSLYYIPVNITLCLKLRSLFLQENSLFQIPNLSTLENLQVLNFADNFLVSSLEQVLELSTLVSLDVSGNQFQGNISSFSKLTNLLELKLDNNRWESFDDPENPLPVSLRYLTISRNQIFELPHGFRNLLNLEVLNMSHNFLFGEIPPWLGLQVNHSFRLDLSSNQFYGQIPAELLQPSAPGQVASLNLSYNSLSGGIPIPLDGGQERFLYDVLDLSYNQLNGPIPFICNNQSTQISSLWLQNNILAGDIVDFFGTGTQAGFNQTIDLRLQNNRFTGDLSRMANTWGNWSNLQVLDLSNNNLGMKTTEAIPDPLGLTLESLGLSHEVTEFRVAGNDFSGTSLPTGYFSGTYWLSTPPNPRLSPFTVLDFSSCHLQGKISDAFFNGTWFHNLNILNFSNNELAGPVLGSVVNISALMVLDVSNNHLSGQLPDRLHLGASYNPSYFIGNALCGDPLPPCGNGMHWWVYLIIVLSLLVALGSLLAALWQWRVYHKRQQQDADLIKTLMGKESATLMPLRELKIATNNFSEAAKIGEGGFGDVYMGNLNGIEVAIKKSKREGSDKDKEQFLNEVRILSLVNHRNLVKLLGCCMENKVSLLVFEFVSSGTLQQHLQGKYDGGVTHLSWRQRLCIAVQTAGALNYLHSGATFPIYHRDVKSANILLTDGLNAKVADFGISKLAPVEATHMSTLAVQGTMGYIDPEYYTTCQLTSKSDVYSFGVVLLELISAKPPIDLQRGEDEISLVHFAKPLIGSGELQRFIDPSLMDAYAVPSTKESILKLGRLAMECLDLRSKARPDMYEVWMELRILLHEGNGTSKYLNSIKEDDNQNRQQDHIILLSDPGSIYSTRLALSSIDEVNSSQTLDRSSGSEFEMMANQGRR